MRAYNQSAQEPSPESKYKVKTSVYLLERIEK
jgi:hypothetical protein